MLHIFKLAVSVLTQLIRLSADMTSLHAVWQLTRRAPEIRYTVSFHHNAFSVQNIFNEKDIEMHTLQNTFDASVIYIIIYKQYFLH